MLSEPTCVRCSEDCPRADDVILCASELAANAALHSRSRLPGGTFTVRATVQARKLARNDGKTQTIVKCGK